MSDSLQFDPIRAGDLRKNLKDKSRDMESTLTHIKGLVDSKVKENWSGASAQAFSNLFASSSKKVTKYLDAWLNSVNDLIKAATTAKKEMEEAESNAIKQAESVQATNM